MASDLMCLKTQLRRLVGVDAEAACLVSAILVRLVCWDLQSAWALTAAARQHFALHVIYGEEPFAHYSTEALTSVCIGSASGVWLVSHESILSAEQDHLVLGCLLII